MLPHRYLRLLAVLAVCAVLPRLAFASIERLGDNVMPSMETLQLHLDPQKDGYSGTATILVEVKSATDTIRFTAKKMQLDHVTIASKTKSKTGAPISLTATADDEGIVTAVAPSRLAPGVYMLTVPFSNEYDRHANALYK